MIFICIIFLVWNNKIILTTSILYPNWRHTKEILETLKKREKYRSIDIEFANIIHTKYNVKLHKPMLFKQNDKISYIDD